jgi:hypothetical protein
MEKSYLQLSCSHCQEHKLQYSPDRSQLVCDACGHTEPLPKNRDTISEQGLSENFSPDMLSRGLPKNFERYSCQKCGTHTAITKGTAWEFCAFCGHKEGELLKGGGDTLRPSAILPFTFPRARAVAAFREWARAGWFTPSAILQAARAAKIKGVFIPFWQFEVLVRASWKASVSAGKGKQAVSGYFEHFFDHINLVNSQQLGAMEWESLGDYSLSDAVPFSPDYLDGIQTELVEGDIKASIRQAEKVLDEEIRKHISKGARGNLQNLSVRARKQLLDVKLLLVPVWIATYTYQGEEEWILINGRDGNLEAEKPTSWVKMVLVILGAIALLIALLTLSESV